MSRSRNWFPNTAVLMSGMLLLSLFILAGGGATPVVASSAVAFDMVGGASQNLNSYTNVWQTGFTATSDGFQKYQRGVSAAIPFQLLDDSLTFTTDSAGIIGGGNTGSFFGVTDTENPENAGPVTAEWSFDISGASNLGLSINMGAMGDFETNDTFTWTYQIDGGAVQTAFANTVDEAASLTYTLEGGAAFTLDDPMLVNGITLSNVLQTFTTPLSGSGSTLLLTLTTSTDGGTEAFAFQDIVIAGDNVPPPAAQIVITEIMKAPSAVNDASGEWLELHNAGTAPVDINGWTIKDDGSDSHVINNGGPLNVPAGGYLVLGNNTDSNTNGGVTVAYGYGSSWYLGNSDGEVVLLDGTLTEIDRVNYDSGTTFPDPVGASMALSDLTLDNNVGANWCAASTPYGSGDLGTPGAANDCAPVGGPPQIVITEIINDPGAVLDAVGEWFEIHNPGTAAVDINGWTMKDDGTNSHVINNGGPLLVPAGAYLVLGNNSDSGTNGGVTVAYQYPSSWSLANGDDEVVLLDSALSEIDRVNYDGGLTFPDPTGASMSLSDLTLDNNVGTNWCTSTTTFGVEDKGTPGAANSCGSGPVPIAKKIHEIQGSGSVVTISDPVIVEAIVVGDFQGGDQLSGFFIQEEDADADGNPATSEGIFVYCGACATAVAVGDLVQVIGVPEDFFDMSQIDVTGAGSLVSVVSSGNALPTAAAVSLLAAGSTRLAATFEAIEGMLVRFSDTLVVSEYFELARYGHLVLTAGTRAPQFTDANAPSIPGYAAFLVDLNSRRIYLDDDNNIQNDALGATTAADEPYYWPRPGLSNNTRIRGGDSISGLTGVMHWSFAGQSGTDAWRVRPVQEAATYTFTANNPATSLPDAVGGSFKVASFNVLNYFTTINSRGADSTAELDRQRVKIAAAICAMDADVVGLMEIENNGSTAIEDLLNGAGGINAVCGTYAYINTGTYGTDEIAQALIYRPATAVPVGAHAILDSSVDSRFIDTRNRPALAQTFEETASGGKLTVVVNHLKSKGSACNPDDPDLGDGQGNCNLTRTAAAAAMVDWLATDPTGSGDTDVLIIGDLNSYRQEDPITALKLGPDDTAATGDDYTDLLDALLGASAYSYVFDGQLGYLDHALANSSLLDQVTGATVWHINADEIPVFDYNDDILDGSNESSFERESTSLPIYEPNALRASDHDPVIVGLDLNGAPVCAAAQPSTTVIWPPNHKMFPVTIQGVTDPNGDLVTISIASIFQDEPVNEKGDGNSGPDGGGIGTNSADLRAERSGIGNGRAYHVYFNAEDTFGASCSGEAVVFVPKNQNKWGPRIDDGPLYDSTQN